MQKNKMKKISIGIFIGLILNLGYFGWEFQYDILRFFQPCQICNNQEIQDCEKCENGFEVKNCKKCVNGKLSIDCKSCVYIECEKCNGIEKVNGDYCLECYGEKIRTCNLCENGEVAGNEDCLICNGSSIIKSPCRFCDAEGETICRFCVKGCFLCRGTGNKDCFHCIKGLLYGEHCSFCDGLGYENCKKCNGTGDH